MRILRNWLVVSAVSVLITGCAASLPDIPPKSSGQGLVDVLHWEYDPNAQVWSHAFAIEILDAKGKQVWSTKTDSIDIPRYTPGLDRSWQTQLPAGKYRVKAGCYLKLSPEYQPDLYEKLQQTKIYNMDIDLASGEYISVRANRDVGFKILPGTLNGRVYAVPRSYTLCRIKLNAYQAKK